MILVLAEAARNINIAAVRMRKHPNLEYIIVLGAHVEGTRLTKALLERTRRALQYMEENPETKAVLSGGKGDGESITEAQAMCNYLVEHGREIYQHNRESEVQSGNDRTESFGGHCHQ